MAQSIPTIQRSLLRHLRQMQKEGKKVIVDILGETIDYIPYKDRLYTDKMVLRWRNNLSFRRVFMARFNRTNQFISDMQDVVNPQHKFTENTIWVMSGETGSSKSSSVMSLIRIILRKRGVWQLFCFTDKQMLDLADEVGDNSFLVRDEDIQGAIRGEGSARTAMQLQVLLETCRVRGISAVFIAPQEQMLGIAKYYLETVDMDLQNRITRLALKDAKTMQYIGAVYVPILKSSDNDWIQYSRMKDEFTKRMRAGEIDDTKNDYNACVAKVMQHEDFEERRTKAERKILVQQCFPNFTIGEIKTIATLLEIRMRQGWITDVPKKM
jgi:hypothetical protein